MGHRVWSCIVQTWTTWCLVFDPWAHLWSDSLALVMKHMARLQGCCLEPFLSLRNLGFWQKWNVVTPRARFGVAYRSLTVYGCTRLLGSCSVSVVDFCLRVERSGISSTRYPRSGTLEISAGLFVSALANGFGYVALELLCVTSTHWLTQVAFSRPILDKAHRAYCEDMLLNVPAVWRLELRCRQRKAPLLV
jgi:hypothetical protein